MLYASQTLTYTVCFSAVVFSVKKQKKKITKPYKP